MERSYRIAVICLLLLTTIGVCVQYGQADRWSYASADAILTEPGTYDGDTVFLFPQVAEIHRDAGLITVEDAPYRVDVGAIDPTLVEVIEPGASIQVYGTYDGDSQVIAAETVVIDMGNPADRLYVYVMSVLGGVLAAGWFLRYWRINWWGLCFEPRGDR